MASLHDQNSQDIELGPRTHEFSTSFIQFPFQYDQDPDNISRASTSSNRSQPEQESSNISRRNPKARHEYQSVLPVDSLPTQVHDEEKVNSLARAVIDWWIIELLACGGSLLAIAGLVIVLYKYDGRSLPNWPYGITINSLVSWFSTAMKALMLVPIAACISQAKWTHFHSKRHALSDVAAYDSASRGPEGSAQFLWKFQARHIASLGALITILAIGIDPLLQQMTSIETRHADTSKATLGRAQSFLQYDSGESFGGDMTFDMLGALYSGIFTKPGGSTGVSFDMNPSCSTGNCTYPKFQSLAVCDYCTDITSSLKHNCSTEKGTDGSSDSIYCTYALPNGLELNTTDMAETDVSGPIATSGNLDSVSTGSKFGNTLVNFTRITRPSRGSNYVGDAHNVSAIECVLYWCVNTYETNVLNGEINETIIDSYYSPTTDWWYGAVRLNNYELNLKPPPINNQTSSLNFTVAYLSSTPLTVWLKSSLSISNSDAYYLLKGGGYSYGPDVSSNSSVTSNTHDTTSNMMRALWQSDISQLFSNLAKSMTRNIREVDWNTQTWGDGWIGPIAGAGTANGTAWTFEVYIHVRWPWLILPVTLVGLTILFLVLTILETMRSKAMVWKSSPLPYLSHGLDEADAQSLRTAAHLAEMEKMAHKVPVKLEETDVGWKLIR
ncbi:MAG: hypothetical protein M1834_002456 [Cirrosporium novae-zelandiae]|nr:MAG: hypothetical protein M1834_002456 [Cirrosporium novae-zelandiae]